MYKIFFNCLIFASILLKRSLSVHQEDPCDLMSGVCMNTTEKNCNGIFDERALCPKQTKDILCCLPNNETGCECGDKYYESTRRIMANIECQNFVNDTQNYFEGKLGYTCLGVTPEQGFQHRENFTHCSNFSGDSASFVKWCYDENKKRFRIVAERVLKETYYPICDHLEQPAFYVCADISVYYRVDKAQMLLILMENENETDMTEFAVKLSSLHRQQLIDSNNMLTNWWIKRADEREKYLKSCCLKANTNKRIIKLPEVDKVKEENTGKKQLSSNSVIIVAIVVCLVLVSSTTAFYIYYKKSSKNKYICSKKRFNNSISRFFPIPSNRENVANNPSGPISNYLEQNEATNTSLSTTNTFQETNDLTVIRELGRGGSSLVHLGIYKNEYVAVKQFFNDVALKTIIHEIEILKGLFHENVLKYIDIIGRQLIMELVSEGSMRRFCNAEENNLTFQQELYIAKGCWNGLSYLHRHKICHKDIKPDNILVTEDLRPVIADFGLSEIKEQMTTNTTSTVGTARYMPPEFATRNKRVRHPVKSDVYSMGASLCELFSKQPFWNASGYEILLFQLIQQQRSLEQNQIPKNPDCWDSMPSKVQSILIHAIDVIYKKRMSAEKLYEMTAVLYEFELKNS